MSKIRGQVSIFEKRPDLKNEWDWCRNININPEVLSFGSHKNVWWKCSLGHSWQAPPNRRTNEKYFRVDGFDPKTDTIYEFLGDFWHGNPEIYNPEDVNPISEKKYGDLYKETMERISLLEQADYSVVYIWEKDFVEYMSDLK